MSLFPGIPQLPPSAAVPVLTLLASEVVTSLLWHAAQVPPAWGVFDAAGNQVLFPDSVLEFSNRVQYDVSRYPVQDGSFADYNKVVEPFELQFRMSKGGTVTDRANFLASINALLKSLEVFTVATPEETFTSVNFERKEVIRRGAKGAYFLTEVDVYAVQIIQVQAQYTTTAVQLPNSSSPAAQPTANVGTVQPQVPSSQVAQDGVAAMGSTPAGFY